MKISGVKRCYRGLVALIICGREMDFEVPGEARFVMGLQEAMGRALVGSGTQSIDGDEIDIDVD